MNIQRSLINRHFVLMIWKRERIRIICLIASIAIRIFLYFIVNITEETRFFSHLHLLLLIFFSNSFLFTSTTNTFSFTCVLCRTDFFRLLFWFAYICSVYNTSHLTASEDYRQTTKMFVLIGMETGITNKRMKKKKRMNDGFKYLCV